MERKEDTPIRVSRRKYEEVHREKRNYVFCGTNLTTVFGTKSSYAGLRQENSERKEEIARNK